MRRRWVTVSLAMTLIGLTAQDSAAFSAFKGRFGGDGWCSQKKDTVLWRMRDHLGSGPVSVSVKSGGANVRIRKTAGTMEVKQPTVVRVTSKSKGKEGYYWVVPVLSFTGGYTYLPPNSKSYWNSYYRHKSGPWSGTFTTVLQPGIHTMGLGHHCRGAPSWGCGTNSITFYDITVTFEECA